MRVMDMLWDSEVCPREQMIADKDTYDALLAKCMQLREELAQALPPEKQGLLDALEEPSLALSELVQKGAFAYGVSIGMNLQKESDSFLIR